MSIRVSKLDDRSYLVDLRGWMCPYPKYMLEPLLRKLPSGGGRLVLLVDCPSAATDVPIEARGRGCEVPEVKQLDNGEWAVTIEAPRQPGGVAKP